MLSFVGLVCALSQYKFRSIISYKKVLKKFGNFIFSITTLSHKGLHLRCKEVLFSGNSQNNKQFIINILPKSLFFPI